jgi:hypothetical protein
LLRATVAAQEGKVSAAADALRKAARIGDDASMYTVAAAARYRHGQLVGGNAGDRLRERASEFVDGQAIVAPGRFFETLAPGFPRG